MRGFSLFSQTSRLQSLSNFAGWSKQFPTRPQASQNRRRNLWGTLRIWIEARMKPGPGCVSARRGWAGDKVTVFSNLL